MGSPHSTETHPRLALAVHDMDLVDLDIEELLNSVSYLNLVGARVDLEAHGVLALLRERGLLSDQWPADNLTSFHDNTSARERTAGSETTIHR